VLLKAADLIQTGPGQYDSNVVLLGSLRQTGESTEDNMNAYLHRYQRVVLVESEESRVYSRQETTPSQRGSECEFPVVVK
ncbi:hypothetical protein GBF38_019011, partial [Nibea albiflora]